MLVKRVSYQLTQPLLRRVRSSRTLIKRLMGVSVPADVSVSFDPTTVLLAWAAASEATAGDRDSLEMGIGEGALVSLSLALSRQSAEQDWRVAGCDCVARRVESAGSVARHNGIEADFFESDLFDAVGEGRQFDLILFNPPYVPTDVGKQLKMGDRLTAEQTMWDGGADGLSVLRRFLDQAPPHLKPGGRLLFGVQHVFVADEAVVAAIEASTFRLLRRHTRRAIPAEVYTLVGKEQE
ncbi:MAG: methyltransferase [Planctomycetota bacterium]